MESIYYKNAIKAAVLIAICNVVPEYLQKIYLIGDFLVSIAMFWKMFTSIIILVYFGKQVSNQYDKYSYGKSYLWSLLSCVISGLFESILFIIYIKFINVTYVQEAIDLVMNMYREMPGYNSNLESFLLVLNKFFFSGFGIFIQYTFSGLIAGAFVSLFSATLIKH